MKTIALFGGSFDPPHIGHERVVKALLELDYIDEVVIMPTFLNPFKSKSFAPAELRLSWLREMFSHLKNVVISSFEIEKNEKVPSIVTVKYLLRSYEKIYLVIGADNLHSLSHWHKFEELNKLVTFIIVTRDGIEIPKNYITLNVDADVSSSDLRNSMDESKLSKINAKKIICHYKENNGR